MQIKTIENRSGIHRGICVLLSGCVDTAAIIVIINIIVIIIIIIIIKIITIITIAEQIKRAADFAAEKGASSWLRVNQVRKMWTLL